MERRRSPCDSAPSRRRPPLKPRAWAFTRRFTSPTTWCRSFRSLAAIAPHAMGRLRGRTGFDSDPEADYDALVKEARGRRIAPASPEHSLLIAKPTGQIPHGGGRRIEP